MEYGDDYMYSQLRQEQVDLDLHSLQRHTDTGFNSTWLLLTTVVVIEPVRGKVREISKTDVATYYITSA